MWQLSVRLLVLVTSLSVSSGQKFPFNNVSLSWAERVWDLVDRLTLDEMVQVGGKSAKQSTLPRLLNFVYTCS